MKICQLLEQKPFKVLTSSANLDTCIENIYACDLLSQVLAKATHKDLWITVQTHATILGIASIKQIPCILFSEDLLPQQEVIDKADEEGIILLASKDTTYEIAGELYNILKKDGGE